jgi:hypothetical protein
MILTALNICNAALTEIAHSTEITDLDATDVVSKACNTAYYRSLEELLTDYDWNFAIARRTIELNSNDRYSLLQSTGIWVASASGTNEYYLPRAAAKAVLGEPDTLYEDDTAMTAGTAGSLSASEWDFALGEDTSDYFTIYVRLSDDTDPDTKYAADNDYLEAEYDEPDNEWSYALPFPADMLRPLVLYPHTTIIEEMWTNEQKRLLLSSDEAELVYVLNVTDPRLFDTYFRRALELLIAAKIAIPVAKSRNLKADALEQFEMAIMKAKMVNAISDNFPKRKTFGPRTPDGAWASTGHSGSPRTDRRLVS